MKIVIELDHYDMANASPAVINVLTDSLRVIARGSIQSNQSDTVKDTEKPVTDTEKQEKPKGKRKAKAEPPKPEPKTSEEEPKQEEPKTPPGEPEHETPQEEPQPVEAVETAEPAKTVPDLKDIKTRLITLREENPDKWNGVIALIKKYSTGEKPSISTVPEDKRVDFLNEVEAL